MRGRPRSFPWFSIHPTAENSAAWEHKRVRLAPRPHREFQVAVEWGAGGNGSDQLLGKGGDDTLYGQKGKDLLDGGLDSDTLDGGFQGRSRKWDR